MIMLKSYFVQLCCFILIFEYRTVYGDVEWDGDKCPKLITRSGWGAKKPKGKIEYLIVPVKNVIIQHTATGQCSTLSGCVQKVASIQSYHLDNNFGDIGLSFLIGGDGSVYEGRGWHQVGAHTIGYNKKSIGIALIGNFEDSVPPQKQLTALRKLLNCGVEMGRLSDDFNLIAHRQVSATLSPGLALFQELQTWPEWSEIS